MASAWQLLTPEKKALYRSNNREKYQKDPEHRARVLAVNRANREKWREQINAKRRERWKSDPEYRAKQLAQKRALPKEKLREYHVKAYYGISPEEYNALLQKQSGRCAICEQPPKKTLHVDHCHETGRVRGLLCHFCNIGLGHFGEDIERMKRAIRYLED